METSHLALASFDRLRGALVATYGQPFSFWGDSPDAYLRTSDPKTRTVSWRTERLVVHLQISHPEHADPKTWQAWITVLGNTHEAKSNQRLERP